jgi:hypothetical protein
MSGSKTWKIDIDLSPKADEEHALMKREFSPPTLKPIIKKLEKTGFLFSLAFLLIGGSLFAAVSERGQLLSSNWFQNETFTTNQCEQFIQSAGTTKQAIKWAQQEIQPQYPVKAYQIIYTSIDHTGAQIPVSGVVLVPQATGPMPLLVYQHATIIENSSAPSEVTGSAQTKALMSVFAADGYVVAMPDYVGTGLVTNYPSEYLYASSEAANGEDIITATQTLLADLNVQTNGQLFLTGYSEGGQAVSALAELLQSNSVAVTAATLMEGPYNMTAVMNHFLSNSIDLEQLPVGSLISAKAIYAYAGIYSWEPLSGIFRFPYDYLVKKDFGVPNPPIWNLALFYPSKTDSMFLSSFLAKVKGGDVGTDIASNDTDAWVPSAFPVTILTSLSDTLIPPEVAIDTYNKMLDAGSTTVRFDHSVFPLNHLQNFFPSIVQSKLIFDKY